MDRNINKSIQAYAESDYESIKEYERYQFLLDHVSGVINGLNESCSTLDIGCAKGEFLYLLKQKYPGLECYGIDYSQELLGMAKKEPLLAQVQLVRGDARTFVLKKEFDITIMSGVLSIFDDISIPLATMVKHTAKNGTGFIFSAFSDGDIDVLVRFRNNHCQSTEWESGWNMFSIETVKKEISKAGARLTAVHPFELKRTLKRKENPVASYTVDTADDKKMILTGGNIRRQFSLLEFKRL